MIDKFLDNILNILNSSTIDTKYILRILESMKSCNEKIIDENFIKIEKIYNILNNEELLLKKVKNAYEIIKINECLNETINLLCKNKDYEIKNNILSGNIEFISYKTNKKLTNNLDLNFDRIEIENDKNIIGLLYGYSHGIDSAFSIEKMPGIYILNTYISDVPEFLNNNKKIAEYAYNRARTIVFKRDFDEEILNVEMLPNILAYNYLSFNRTILKNALKFSFIFGETGELYSVDVSRKKIKLNGIVNVVNAKKILFNEKIEPSTKEVLDSYRELYKILNNKEVSNDLYSVKNLLLLGTFLTNDYIAKNTNFYIGSRDGMYVEKKYTNSAESTMTLKSIVSDINLAFFLDEHNIEPIDKNVLIRIRKNLDKILLHVNNAKAIQNFVVNNPEFSKKYVKEIEK